jgi:predicted metalloprotease
MAVGGGGLGVLLIALVAMFLGADGDTIARLLGGAQPGQGQIAPGPAGGVDDEAREFLAVVLRDTETVWSRLFDENVRDESGRPAAYQPPKLVIYAGQDRSACGIASAAVGPFYCPADQKVYIDPSFFDQLARRHRAPGDFAQAYVVAHEVGHHVQNLLGFIQIVDKVRRQGNELAANQASVRLELQADYLAGVWAHHAHREYEILEAGDIEEALQAANQIGDDTLQLEAQGYVVPDRFTHGKSEQRVRWFREGLRTGDLDGCRVLFEMDYAQL